MAKRIRDEITATASCPHTGEDVKQIHIAKLQKKLDEVYECL